MVIGFEKINAIKTNRIGYGQLFYCLQPGTDQKNDLQKVRERLYQHRKPGLNRKGVKHLKHLIKKIIFKCCYLKYVIK
jgi:hypothetical protein